MDSQVLSAGSLFVSHLCPPNLSDLSNVSEPAKFSAQQLLDRQYDEEGWNWLIVVINHYIFRMKRNIRNVY